MRNILIIILVSFIFIEIDAQTSSFKRIGLINPTTKNIERIVFLMHNYFTKADSIQIIGICHGSQKELIKSSKQYVNDQGYKYISFELIDNQVPLDSLFVINKWTAAFKRIFSETDAMIFLGGADIPPKIYGEKTFITTDLIPEEQNWEISFLYHLVGGSQNDSFVPLLAQRPDYVVLGICLGMQEMNVASGGSLCQDIPSQIYGLHSFEDIISLPTDNQHKNYWNRIDNTQKDLTTISFHHLNIVKKSSLDILPLSGSPLVASIHHQCVKKLGKNYKVTATSTDKKVIEAFSNEKFNNVYGIQFHTDILALYDDNAKFKISPNQTLQLGKEDRQFHINFWKDFSRRLNMQK